MSNEILYVLLPDYAAHEAVFAAHREYIAKHYAAGDFIASGPQTPRVGGVIMMKFDNRETVNAIIAEDPFHVNGIADYQIVEFTPTMFAAKELKNYLL